MDKALVVPHTWLSSGDQRQTVVTGQRSCPPGPTGRSEPRTSCLRFHSAGSGGGRYPSSRPGGCWRPATVTAQRGPAVRGLWALRPRWGCHLQSQSHAWSPDSWPDGPSGGQGPGPAAMWAGTQEGKEGGRVTGPSSAPLPAALAAPAAASDQAGAQAQAQTCERLLTWAECTAAQGRRLGHTMSCTEAARPTRGRTAVRTRGLGRKSVRVGVASDSGLS